MTRLHIALFASLLTLPVAPVLAAKKPHATAAASAAAPASEPASVASGPSKGKEILSINDEDAGMQAAFRKAQATLDDFLAVVKSKNPKIDNIAVRIQVRDHKLVDYLWILPFKQTAKGFSGYVNNVPRVITKIQAGQELDFKRADIIDWMYVDNRDNTMHGSFTTCAMMVNAPAAEQEEMKTKYGLDCSKQ